jgi:hypothetical protein
MRRFELSEGSSNTSPGDRIVWAGGERRLGLFELALDIERACASRDEAA